MLLQFLKSQRESFRASETHQQHVSDIRKVPSVCSRTPPGWYAYRDGHGQQVGDVYVSKRRDLSEEFYFAGAGDRRFKTFEFPVRASYRGSRVKGTVESVSHCHFIKRSRRRLISGCSSGASMRFRSSMGSSCRSKKVSGA